MNRSEKITLAAAAVVLVGLVALAAPAVGTLGAIVPTPAVEEPAAERSAEPVATKPRTSSPVVSTPKPTEEPEEEEEEDGCRGVARIIIQWEGDSVDKIKAATVNGGQEIQERGPMPGANGTLSEDRSTYIVAPGDTISGIGDRVCVSWVGLEMLNDDKAGEWLVLQPGDEIIIDPRINKSWQTR
ncbi:LysM domain-containing protein [Microbacterium sp. 179-B 1A2 NHS]|uniref:LysM peptidoglycan-binding domain-containing protein n=1 Tax=Microbacterium sp. 179-B 1A2 NHS TaxID=3142383 RepID=UPI00399FC921